MDQYQGSTYRAFASNRNKARQPKLGKFWCFKCDAALVAPGAKCVNCGAMDTPKRLKKDQA